MFYKYIPKTGDWGQAEVCYVTTIGREDPNHRRLLHRWTATGWLAFHEATFEQMPTQYHIVNYLAKMECLEVVSAGLTETMGGVDGRGTRIVH